MITLSPSIVELSEETPTVKRAFWYQNQYAIANRHGSPQEYVRGRIVRKLGDYFYIKPFNQKESVAMHHTKIEFFSEDGKQKLTKEQVQTRLQKGDKL